MWDQLNIVLLISVSIISICSAEENATLVVSLEYPTPYYGDRINLTCVTHVDEDESDTYICTEFAIQQNFYSTYLYGDVCCERSSDYSWPGFTPTPQQCTPQVDGQWRTINVGVTMTRDMHDSNADWIKHVCILHYEYYSFWGNGEDKLLSNGVEIPIKSINEQTITLGPESGEVLEGTPSVRLRCTSTNTEASQLTISQTSGASISGLSVTSPAVDDDTGLLYSVAEFPLLTSHNNTEFSCSDGGRPVDGRTTVPYTLVVIQTTTTSTTTTTTTSKPTTTTTTPRTTISTSTPPTTYTNRFTGSTTSTPYGSPLTTLYPTSATSINSSATSNTTTTTAYNNNRTPALSNQSSVSTRTMTLYQMSTKSSANPTAVTPTVITTPTTGPLVADAQLLYSQTEPVFAGDFYDVICMANFSTTPTTVEDMKIARRSTPARPLPESVFCPEPGTWANYWKPEPDIDAVVDCTSFDDTLSEGSTLRHYRMSIRVEAVPVSATVGITMQEYGCRIEYNSNVRQYSEWLQGPTVYQLPQFPSQNISTQVLRGSTPNMTCIYESDDVPVTIPPIKLRMLHQSAGVLNEVDLQSKTTVMLTATLESDMTNSDFEITCEIFSDLSTRVRSWPETVTTPVTVYDITTKATTKAPATSPTVPIQTTISPPIDGLAAVNMSLVEVEPDSTPSVLRYGKRAKFRCRATLAQPLSDSDELDGISLMLNDSRGNTYEDGCLEKTILSADKTFFTDTVKRCPVFSPSTRVYEAEIGFTVTQQFIGQVSYQCMFRTQYWSYVFRGWYPVAGVASPVVTLNGLALPEVTIRPAAITGFENEIKDIMCISTGGHPEGNVTMSYADGKNFSNATVEKVGRIQNMSVQIEMTRALNGKRIICANTVHKTSIAQSEAINVKYLRLLNNGTVRIEDIAEDIHVDCASNIDTNTNTKYRWGGSIVPYSQIEQAKVDLLYSSSRSGGLRRIDCFVTMIGDPIKREWKIRYLLYYKEARTPGKLSSNNNSGIAVVIVAILMVTLAIIGYAVGREITSRKINNRVVTRDLEKHHSKIDARKANESQKTNKRTEVQTTFSQTDHISKNAGTMITDDSSPKYTSLPDSTTYFTPTLPGTAP